MLIIGFAGGTGSGKTTVVNRIIKDFSTDEICVISQDAYYKVTDNLSFQERTKINFDHPRAIDFDLLIKHLKALKKGKTINQPVYSFITHNRTKEVIKTQPKKVVIVEGILIFNSEKLRDLFNIKIFVHADADECLVRRIRRDIAKRARDVNEVLDRYQDTLKPMYKQFIAPTKKFSDLIIPNNRYNTVAIDILKSVINDYL